MRTKRIAELPCLGLDYQLWPVLGLRRSAEAKPWMAQGVRFGVAVALLTTVPTYMIYFVVQPMPGDVVIKQIIFDGVLMIMLGIIVAWLYRDAATSLRAG
jgi:hypothetical protein